MEAERLRQLKTEAEKRCEELFTQSQNVLIALERSRGDYRTYESLLNEVEAANNQPVTPENTSAAVTTSEEVPEAEVVS